MSYSQKIPNACQHSACSMGRRAGRLDRAHRALRLYTLGWWLGAGLVAVAVNRAALIWILDRMGFLNFRGLDGLIRIPRLPACCAARLRRPEMHRLRGDPEGQAATVAQAIFILRPVAYPELHLRNVMAALGVEFFGHAVSQFDE